MPKWSRAQNSVSFLRSQMAKVNMPRSFLQHLFAPLLVPVQQNFGVGPGGEGVPGAHQFGGQLLEVVDLAVKDDGEVLVLIEHGLLAALQVNDGKAALAKGCRAFNKLAPTIGAAVGDGIHHALQNFLHVGACADKANNSTWL